MERIRIGFCANTDRLTEIRAAGYDYIEPPVSATAAMSEEEFRQVGEKLRESGLPALSFNVLFPGSMVLLENSEKTDSLDGYLSLAFSRVRELGGRVVVFGSGKSRTRPESLSYDEAFRRLVKVTRRIGEWADRFGIQVAIEPLNRGETNMICSVAEGACLRGAVNHPAVGLLADFYHIAVERQPPEDLARVGGIQHAHIATLEGRRAPVAEEPGFREMLGAMKKSGYQGMISVEGRTEDLVGEGQATRELIQGLWREA